jgi:hypothetical protein
MIKFFRKIRQNLLMENKTGKYFKYAIGEIVLVMIGILLALQVNNWNENRKLDILKRTYLQSLLTDLSQDSLKIENRISFSNEKIEEYERYVKKFDSVNWTLREITSELSKIDAGILTITFRTNTIEVLKSTGDIKLIAKDIRNKAIDLNRKQEYINLIIKRNTNNSLNQFNELGKLGWFESSGRLLKNSFVKELAFKYMFNEEKYIELIYAVESAFRKKYDSEVLIKENYEEILVDIAEIRTLIQLELN